MITLNDGVNAIIQLPNALEWTDEYTWSNIGQDVQPTIGGGLVISESIKLAGRPITLSGGESVWVLKSVVDSLYTASRIINNVYVLTLSDGRTFNVMFDRSKPSIEPKQVHRKNLNAVTDNDYYSLTINLMEV